MIRKIEIIVMTFLWKFTPSLFFFLYLAIAFQQYQIYYIFLNIVKVIVVRKIIKH